MERVVRIDETRGPADLAGVRTLFEEYQASLPVSLDFQGFAAELAALPGAYAPPRGALLLAWVDGEVAGCAALRPLEGAEAEVKRLYVRPAYRGLGLGERLMHALCERARDAGYQALRLDTLATMGSAMKLYERLGFVETHAYHRATLPGMRFFRKALEGR
jgi:ribosomal protein S18 acetylase RimI-like enzyme